MKSSKRHNEVDLRVAERVGIPLIVFMLNAHCRDNDQGSRSSLVGTWVSVVWRAMEVSLMVCNSCGKFNIWTTLL